MEAVFIIKIKETFRKKICSRSQVTVPSPSPCSVKIPNRPGPGSFFEILAISLRLLR
tara:strand:+ start:95 stop:265 length:171 start_codon:yes stop_codon:yes gene_type:complete